MKYKMSEAYPKDQNNRELFGPFHRAQRLAKTVPTWASTRRSMGWDRNYCLRKAIVRATACSESARQD